MAVTTQQQEYKRLRSYLNPYIQGPNVTAVLNALAAGSSSYLVNNSAAVNDQLYITTASGVYLDALLANYGIVRPSNVGLSDDIFSQLGIQIKNRKQVRDLLNRILNIMFGDELTRATNDASVVEPYNLADGDTLIINYDERETVTVTFSTNQFENIHAALAIEVADAIAETLVSQGFTGTATTNNNGAGNYVELISSTIGPASSVTVLGGSAQNQLKFPEIIGAGGTPLTQWTVSLQPGGLVRFTWSGGPNPSVGAVSVGNYVNIYGGGFLNSGYEGTFPIVNVVGGAVDIAYFEVSNPLAPAPGGGFNPVTQGGTALDPTILFFNPVRETLQSLPAYAAIYQTQSATLQIFVPAYTKVVRRSRIGSAHLHYAPNVVFTFTSPEFVPSSGGEWGYLFDVSPANATTGATYTNNGSTFTVLSTIAGGTQLYTSATGIPSLNGTLTKTSGTGDATITFDSNPNSGDAFSITTVNTLVAGVDFVIGATFLETMVNLELAINAGVPGVVAIVSVDPVTKENILTVFQDSPSLILTGTYTGTSQILTSGLIGDPISVQPNQPGPYMYDLTQPFEVSTTNTTLTQNLDGTDPRIFTVTNASQFPDAQGYLIFDYGYETQEGPVPYIGRPSDTTLLISPAYTIMQPHTEGSTVSLIAKKGSVTITQDGTDYPFYITDVVAGRVYAQQLIEEVAAVGINVIFTILYPNDIGLGKWGTQYSEISLIWGEIQ